LNPKPQQVIQSSGSQVWVATGQTMGRTESIL